MRTLVHATIVAASLVGLAAPRAHAQLAQTPAGTASDSTSVAPVSKPVQESHKAPRRDRIYHGGGISLSFGNVFRIGVYPMIGYNLTPKASLGVEVGYEYLSYDNPNTSTSNYGGSAFARYSILPQIYARGKFSLVNYETFSASGSSSRTTVPFLLLGAGAVQRIGPGTSAYAEVLVDVLQDDNSPYDNWEPFISVGVGVGF